MGYQLLLIIIITIIITITIITITCCLSAYCGWAKVSKISKLCTIKMSCFLSRSREGNYFINGSTVDYGLELHYLNMLYRQIDYWKGQSIALISGKQ